MRKTFHEELKSFRAKIFEMGRLVERAIDNSVRSLIANDEELAAAVIAGDDKIDDLNLEIEKESMYVIARQCPVAGDLRLVFSTLFISIHLERMGDLSLNMAKIARRTNEEESLPSLMELISKMGDQVRLVVRTSLEAFENNDVELAKTLPILDDPIDDYFKTFFKELVSTAAKKGAFEWAGNMVLASRYLERIADHAVDIGELITYLVTGVKEEWD